MKPKVLLWSALLLFGTVAGARTEEPAPSDFSRHVRLYSATWCGYCKQDRKSVV